MSQVDVVKRSRFQERGAGLKARVEAFVKSFEWTWTNAVLFSLVLTFFILLTTSVIPSFWLYYAEQVLGWGGPTDVEAFLKMPFDPFPHPAQETYLQIRDAIAMGLTTLPIVVILVVAAALQNWRKKLRGGAGDTRPTGGYR
jgi:hypothetical protein